MFTKNMAKPQIGEPIRIGLKYDSNGSLIDACNIERKVKCVFMDDRVVDSRGDLWIVKRSPKDQHLVAVK